MLEHIKSAERGHADHGWLKSAHSFSFADYHNPKRMGFGALRVINDDRIAPGTGFGTHGHRDMEIVSYVLQGGLAHQDSINPSHAGVLKPGDVQRMSAGTGVRHSEFNHSQHEETHFVQIWLMPHQSGHAPRYDQTHVGPEKKRGRLALLVSPDGEDGSLSIHADARIHAGLFHGAESAALPIVPGRMVYVHLVRGQLTVNGVALQGGDALQLREEAELHLSSGQDAEVLVFDLAADTH